MQTNQKNQFPSEQIGSKMVFENDTIRVWHTSIAPGAHLPLHIHARPYFWTSLSAGTSVSHYANGDVKTFDYQAGDTRYFQLSKEKPIIHDLHNIGETTLKFVTVEFLSIN